MARLTSIMLLLGLVYASVSYSLVNAPQASADDGGAAGQTTTGISPTEALVFVGPSPVPEPTGSTTLATYLFGVYSVGDSADEREARYDRDVRPRTPLFEEDDRLTYDLHPAYIRRIQGEITPGLYSTASDAAGCSYELHRVMRKSRAGRVIGEDYLEEGRLLVSINGIEPDWFTSTASCGAWFEWRPRADPTAPAPSGDYWIGDLAPGLWLVPADCLWETVAGFRGASLRDVVDNGHGPGLLMIDAETPGVRLRGCRQPVTLLS